MRSTRINGSNLAIVGLESLFDGKVRLAVHVEQWAQFRDFVLFRLLAVITRGHVNANGQREFLQGLFLRKQENIFLKRGRGSGEVSESFAHAH
jgi:hypothetical protein